MRLKGWWRQMPCKLTESQAFRSPDVLFLSKKAPNRPLNPILELENQNSTNMACLCPISIEPDGSWSKKEPEDIQDLENKAGWVEEAERCDSPLRRDLEDQSKTTECNGVWSCTTAKNGCLAKQVSRTGLQTSECKELEGPDVAQLDQNQPNMSTKIETGEQVHLEDHPGEPFCPSRCRVRMSRVGKPGLLRRSATRRIF